MTRIRSGGLDTPLTLILAALLGFASACSTAAEPPAPARAATPSPELVQTPTRSPAPMAAIAPRSAPAAARESVTEHLARLTVAVARPDGPPSMFCGDAQTMVSAAWAGGATMHCPLATGQALFGIGPTGVLAWTTRVRDGGVEIEGATITSEPELLLVADRRPTQPDPRVRRGALAPVDREPNLAAFVATAVRHPLVAVGELRGAFGGGVDQIVVYAPARRNDGGEDDPSELASCAALLVASGTPRGFLALPGAENRPADDDGMLLSGLGVGGVTDVDGDGIEEVIWVSQLWGGDDALAHTVSASYHADGAFHLHELVSRSYGGFESFLQATAR